MRIKALNKRQQPIKASERMMQEIRKRPLAPNCTYSTCPQQLRKCPVTKHEWSCMGTAMSWRGDAFLQSPGCPAFFVQGVHPTKFSTSQERRPISLSAPHHGVQQRNRQEYVHRTTCCTSVACYAALLRATHPLLFLPVKAVC